MTPASTGHAVSHVLDATPVLAAAAGDGAGTTLWPQVGLVAVLIALNAAFAGSEMALVSLRDTQIRRLDERGGSGRVLATLARDPNRFLSTIQIGITLAGFLASATATVAFAELLVEPLAFLGGAARPTAIVVVTGVLTFLTLVFGELAPKLLALQRAEPWALVSARPLALLATLAGPAVWVLTAATNLTVRLAGGDPDQARDDMSEEELRDLVTSRRQLSAEQRTIMTGAFDIAERSLREIVVPRPAVFALTAEQPAAQAARALLRARHSRAPVHRADDLDAVVGMVHLRDLVDADGPVGAHARPPLVLPETTGVLAALRRMRGDREHLAMVVDEYGGFEGIVTLEDLLEEIVGEIYDEFDRDLDPTDVRGVERADDGSILLPGTFPMHDLDELGVSLPDGNYTTVAGAVLEHLGRIPEQGEAIDLADWHVTVVRRDRNAISALRLRPADDAHDDDPGDDHPDGDGRRDEREGSGDHRGR